MKAILSIFSFTFLLQVAACSQATQQPTEQSKTIAVGDGCEGCEAIYESPIPHDELPHVDTLPDFNEPGPKLQISGIIYGIDGKPAKDVVVYVYHTNQEGLYADKHHGKGWEKRHGYIRGWMKTNERGEYKFLTLLPASYPNSRAVKHIHPVIKEPGKSEYWIDEFIFDDDPFLYDEPESSKRLRGGDGLIKLKKENGMLVGHRDIFLGKNIPNYPK